MGSTARSFFRPAASFERITSSNEATANASPTKSKVFARARMSSRLIAPAIRNNTSTGTTAVVIRTRSYGPGRPRAPGFSRMGCGAAPASAFASASIFLRTRGPSPTKTSTSLVSIGASFRMAATLPTTTPTTPASRKAFATVARKAPSKLKGVAAPLQGIYEQLALRNGPQQAVDDQVEVIRIDFGKLRAKFLLQPAHSPGKQIDVARPPAPHAIAANRCAFLFAPAAPATPAHFSRVHREELNLIA